MKSNSTRLLKQIEELFQDYYKKAPPSKGQGEALANLRQLIYRSISVFVGEAEIAKRYGVPVDALSLISFDDSKWPPGWTNVDFRNSWIPIPSEGEVVRPAGITNEEYSDYLVRLRAEFRLYWEKESPRMASNKNYAALFYAIELLFRDAFLRPATNIPFRGGTYVRITVGTPATIPLAWKEDIARQNVPCQVCGENRVTDTCHIIPRSIGGSPTIDNLLFLCPTHHALLDRGMLTREEWARIEWPVKNKKSQIYALKVLKPVHEKFWNKVEAGVFEKKHEGAPKGEMRTLYSEFKDEIETDKGS